VNGAFDNMKNLSSIDLSNNQIKNFDANFLNNLTNVNLSNNKIQECNISSIKLNAVVDLTSNYLSDFSKLTLPQNVATIYLSNNFLTQDLPQTSCTLIMGFQGLKNNQSLFKGDKICLYEGMIDGESNPITTITVSKKQGDDYVFYKSCGLNESIVITDLGYFKLEFSSSLLQKLDFTCIPTAPQVKMFAGEKEYEQVEYKVNEAVKIQFIGDGEIHYIFKGTEVLGNEFNISSYGAYQIQYWQIIDGMQSETEVITIYSSYVPPIIFVWIVIGIVGFVLLFYVLILFKNNIGKQKKEKVSLHGKGFE
ncbi:MAG: leucine-rich repeat domain-containing protein, partial [Clostridiales bacterium]|nr:leucine-rich repeat domain-containing protein [Candidatus Apopatousia equi]